MANRRFIDFPIASTVNDNDIVLIWQDGLNKQTTKGTLIQGAPTSLEGLTDVDLAGLINGQILQYNSTTGKWENVDRTDINLSQLGDVSIVSPSDGQVLVYNSSTSKWENSSGGYVPYVGAVTTVDLGAQGLIGGYIRFNTSVVSVPNEQGLMYWEDSKSTVALIMNGTTQHIGQDTYFYVKNSTGSNIAKGVAVRFDGTDGASGHLLIAPFLADGTYPSAYFMGVTAEAIGNGEFGQVTNFGEIEGINTSGYSAGALLYASTTSAGAFQTTAPVAPNNIVLIAAAVNSKNNGAIIVRPTYGSNINDDEGVKIVSPTTGDLLQLQAGGLWENKTKAQVLGGTSSQFVKGDGSLDSTSYQPLLTNPVTGTGTTNYLPKFTSASTIGDSRIFDNGTNVGINTITPNDFIDGESGMAILQSTNGRAVLSLVGTRTDAGEALGRISFTNSNSTNVGGKRLAYISGVRGTTNNSAYLEFAVANDGLGTAQMILSQTGNLGLGVTPSAWASSYKVAQYQGGFVGSNGTSFIYFGQNAYSDGTFKYLANGLASVYAQDAGNHIWYQAPSGTANNAISFTPAMTLFSTGNLGIGVGGTDSGFKLQVNGEGRFYQPATTSTAYLRVENNRSRNAAIRLTTTVGDYYLGVGIGADVNQFQIYDGNAGANRLTISSTGAATFSNSASGNALTVGTTYAGGRNIQIGVSDGSILPTASAYINDNTGVGIYIGDNSASTKGLYVKYGGNVGIGTNNPESLSNNTTLQIDGTNHSFVRTGTSNYGGYFATIPTAEVLCIANVRNPVTGTYNNTGKAAAGINLFSQSSNGYIEFLTTSTNNSGPYPRMTITSGGQIVMGRTTPSGSGRLTVDGDLYLHNITSGAGQSTLKYNYTSTGLVTYDTSSRLLKKNIENLSYGLNDVLKMSAKKYNWKRDESVDLGFIADEMVQIIPEIVFFSTQMTNLTTGVPVGEPLSINYDRLIPVLVKAIQELKQEIDTLKNN